MTDVLWPPDLCPVSQTWGTQGNVASFVSPFTGVTKNYGRPGVRRTCSITLPPLKGENRARMLAVIAALKDRSNAIWVRDFTTTLETGLPVRGSFAAPEVFTNNNFVSGTTGWTGLNSTLYVSDRVLRSVYNGASVGGNFGAFQTGRTVTQYAPYVLRGFIRAPLRKSGWQNGVNLDASNYSAAGEGLFSLVNIPLAATTGAAYPAVFAGAGSTDFGIGGDFGECHFASLARCMLVDNGPNSATYSDQIDNAAWTKTACSVSANGAYAPDGTLTADIITENGASSVHQFTQHPARASAAEDLTVYGYFKRGTGTRDVRLDAGDGGSNYALCIFDLNAGTAGTPGLVGTATNARAHIVGVGYGWYFCSLTCRSPASTAMFCDISMINAGSTSYAGDGASQIYAWRVGCARSGVPTVGGQTVASALATGTIQTSNRLYVKGLPASTQNLLKAGDMVQIGGQINQLTATLDSNAAGLGVLICGNPWRSPADNAPVIVNTPMCKMQLASDTIDVDTGPGQFSSVTLEFVEAID